MTNIADILEGADLAHVDAIQKEILNLGGNLRDPSWNAYAAARRQNLETRAFLARAPQEQLDKVSAASKVYVKAILDDIKARQSDFDKWLNAKNAEYKRAATEETRTIALAIARQVAGRNLAISIAVATVIALVSLIATSGYGYHKGYITGVTEGHERGVAESRDERAAAAWGNTSDGKWAYNAWKGGIITFIRTCVMPGMPEQAFKVIKSPDGKDVCVSIIGESGKPSGWYLDPPSEKDELEAKFLKRH